MPRFKRLPLIFHLGLFSIYTLLVGCDSASTEQSPLAGVWVPTSCEQPESVNSVTSDVWVSNVFQFTADGEILLGQREYTDADCGSLKSSTQPERMDEFTVRYSDKGPQQLEEGISGRKLTIEVESTKNQFSVDAYFTINDGLACFSDVFTFKALSFAVSQGGMEAIDFEHCLQRLSANDS